MTHLPTPDHLGDPNNEVPILNIPNLLTVARLFMVPIFGYLVLAVEQTDSAQWASAAVFLIAALTDLARMTFGPPNPRRPSATDALALWVLKLAEMRSAKMSRTIWPTL